MKIQIAGKEYEIKGTMGSVAAILKKYDLENLHKLKAIENFEFIVDVIWQMFSRRIIFFKPFVFKWYFKKVVTITELNKVGSKIPKLLYGEDKETKN